MKRFSLRNAGKSLTGHIVVYVALSCLVFIPMGLDIVAKDEELTVYQITKVVLLSVMAGWFIAIGVWFTITKPYLDRTNSPRR